MQALRDLADRLLVAYAADRGNASLAREARLTLLAVMGREPDPADDELAALLAAMPPV